MSRHRIKKRRNSGGHVIHSHLAVEETRIQAHISEDNHQDGVRTQTQEKWFELIIAKLD